MDAGQIIRPKPSEDLPISVGDPRGFLRAVTRVFVSKFSISTLLLKRSYLSPFHLGLH